MKVSPLNVLVIFYSCCGETEKLALSAAVGAVQARASIRMRRLTDAAENVAEIPECRETLARMRREYVPPTAADALWADAVIIGMKGTVAGVARDPASATAFGREMAAATRTIKEQSDGG